VVRGLGRLRVEDDLNMVARFLSIEAACIAEAIEEDPAAAEAEYLATFRRDIESAFTVEALDAVIVPNRTELPYDASVRYSAFLDFAGGSGRDSATLAIGHRGLNGIGIIDAIRESGTTIQPGRRHGSVRRALSSVPRQRHVRSLGRLVPGRGHE
jgi:hypothetical protein